MGYVQCHIAVRQSRGGSRCHITTHRCLVPRQCIQHRTGAEHGGRPKNNECPLGFLQALPLFDGCPPSVPPPLQKMLSSLSRLSSATLVTSHTLAPIRTMFVRVTSTPNVAMQRLNEKLSEEGLERLMKARKVCLSPPPLALPALGVDLCVRPLILSPAIYSCGCTLDFWLILFLFCLPPNPTRLLYSFICPPSLLLHLPAAPF